MVRFRVSLGFEEKGEVTNCNWQTVTVIPAVGFGIYDLIYGNWKLYKYIFVLLIAGIFGMVEVDEGNAEGQVPQSWLDQPPLTSSQKRLFKQYPDARSCLPKEERDKQELDYTRFDWSSVRNDDHAMVCVYRIAQQLQTPEAMAEWFKSFGFVYITVWQSGFSNKSIVLDAGILFKDRWPLYPGWFSFSRYTKSFLAHSYGVQVRWYSDGQLGSVQIGYTYE